LSDDIPTVERPKTSTRDLAETHDALERWLTARLGRPVTISQLEAPPTNGMSSETILFEATWDGQTSGLVGRIPPDPANAPVFPTYDIPGQFRTMSLVRELTDVPVPEPLWVEDDASIIGQPFFVMRRVDGVVPPDVMPYTFGGNWLFDGTGEQRRRLEATSVEVLAALHAVPEAERHFDHLHRGVSGESPLRRHFQKELLDYYAWAAEETRSPLVERCFAWLQEHWPEERETVLSWGDARIGNILYRDFEPVAVLDWEMASLGPREVDVAWLQYLHRFFQDLAEGYGMPGLPDLLVRDRVVDAYEAATGYRCRDMDWYAMLAATRHGVISLRTGIRGVQFGQSPMPDDVDDLIMHRRTLEQMLDGTYWEDK
jgi:aminoglycoside phosphotransferase (APT) family kinase protein